MENDVRRLLFAHDSVQETLLQLPVWKIPHIAGKCCASCVYMLPHCSCALATTG